MKIITHKLKNRTQEIQREVKQKMVKYITAAFGLVAGLAWNDAVKSLIEYFFPLNKNTVLIKLLYALTMTVVLVIISIYLMRLLNRGEKN